MLPIETEDDFSPTYRDLIDSMQVTVIFEYEVGDYQGDTMYLLQQGWNKYGYLHIGWGSCSGCDALQDVIDYDWPQSKPRVEEFRDELFSRIEWFDSKEAVEKFLREHDWDGDYIGKMGRAFAKAALVKLNPYHRNDSED